jgi:hypothetical protein
MGDCRRGDGLGRDARRSSLRRCCRGCWSCFCAGSMVGPTPSGRCAVGTRLCWGDFWLVGLSANSIHMERTRPRGSDHADRARRRGRDAGKTRRGSAGSPPGERGDGAMARSGSRR